MTEKFPIAQPEGEPKIKKSFRERILNNKTAKLAAILLLISGFPKALEAASNKDGNDPENIKNKTEDSRANLNKIITLVNEQDESLSHTLNNQKVKTFQFPGGQEVVVGDNNSFTMILAKEGRKVFYDDDCDGSVDRIIINQEEEGQKRSLVYNGMYALDDMENLAEQADIIADLKPENVKIMDINHESKEVKFVDMSTGESGTFDNENAEELIIKMQVFYDNELAKINTED